MDESDFDQMDAEYLHRTMDDPAEERDDLRQQLAAAVERAERAASEAVMPITIESDHEQGFIDDLRARAEAAEATVAGLRDRLVAISVASDWQDTRDMAVKALAATPAQHAARIVSKWLRERAEECSGERVDLEPWLREQAAYLAGEGPLTGNCGNPLIVVLDRSKEEARIRERVLREAAEKLKPFKGFREGFYGDGMRDATNIIIDMADEAAKEAQDG